MPKSCRFVSIHASIIPFRYFTVSTLNFYESLYEQNLMYMCACFLKSGHKYEPINLLMYMYIFQYLTALLE